MPKALSGDEQTASVEPGPRHPDLDEFPDGQRFVEASRSEIELPVELGYLHEPVHAFLLHDAGLDDGSALRGTRPRETDR